jgi:O-acetyl-ADP-ribose deacetylase (regulator of RNase III)
MPIEYVTGDATRPRGSGPKVICHCVNDIGQWGSGFVLALRARWPQPERAYRDWHRTGTSALEISLDAQTSPHLTARFNLGSVQFVEVERELWVANLVGQRRNIQVGEKFPIRYGAMEDGLRIVAAFCQHKGATAHMPRIGAGLARGDWTRIASIIDATLTVPGVHVTVYDLPKAHANRG